MAQFRTGASAATDLADTDHIIEKAKQHWRKLAEVGALEAELKELERNAQAAHKIIEIGLQPPERNLEMVRDQLRDLLGQFRRAGAVVANGFGGRDAQAEKQLGLNLPFPETDKRLKAHLGIVESGMRKYSDKLARRGFSKEEQRQFMEVIQQYRKLLGERGKERGEARKMRADRDAILEVIRTQTRYFRRLGRLALADSASRADFDRVKRPGRAPRKSAAPAPQQPQAAVVAKA